MVSVMEDEEEVSAAENEVLRAFERWSQESRISISSIKPQWKRAGDDFMTLECRADASGSMQELTRFLYDVERDPLALRVESVEITTRDNNGQQLSLALQVSWSLILSNHERKSDPDFSSARRRGVPFADKGISVRAAIRRYVGFHSGDRPRSRRSRDKLNFARGLPGVPHHRGTEYL